MGEATQAATGGLSWIKDVTRYQWMVFLVAWLGWTLDATDFGLFTLVLRPALTELWAATPPIAHIGRVGGFLSMAGLLGWALGGFAFGIVGDYIGRIRTLVLSVVLVARVHRPARPRAQHLMLGIFRFFTGVGTGAEIVVGIPLVAEAFAEQRAKVLGIMMTGGGFGNLIGGQIFAMVGPYGWRYVMFAGVLPALVLLLLRRGMEEPERFKAVQARRAAPARPRGRSATADGHFLGFAPKQLFTRELRYSTFIGMLFCVGTLLAIWTSQIWLPTIQAQLLEKVGHHRPGGRAVRRTWHDAVGAGRDPRLRHVRLHRRCDRPAAGGGVLQCRHDRRRAVSVSRGRYDWDLYPYLLPVFGYFVFGVFSGHAVYLPELFPTQVRATAVSFCNGTGRVITSFGPLVAGFW